MADSNEEIMDATAEMIDTAAAVPPVADMPEGTEAPATDPGLNLNDIQGCVTIIDLVTKRGAFEGPELADVGAVRNRLAAFLEAAKAAQEPAEGGAETPAE